MTEKKYKIVFCDVETGILLIEDGTFNNSSEVKFKPTFATLSEAHAKQEELLSKFAHAEVWIHDIKNDKSISRNISPMFDEYNEEKRNFLTWYHSFWLSRIFKKKPKLKYKENVRLAEKLAYRGPK